MLVAKCVPAADNLILTNLLSRLFSRSPSAATTAVDDLLSSGYRLQRAGDALKAEHHYRDALKRDAASADAHYLLGALLGERGDLTGAATHLDRALALKPGSAEAHAARGNVHLMREERAAAIASYGHALRLDDESAAAHFNLGLILQADLAREQAFAHFLRAYELEPEIPDLLKNLTLSYIDAGRYDAKGDSRFFLAKHTVCANAIKAVDLAVGLIANPGLTRHNPLERLYRDVLCGRVNYPQDDMVLASAGRAALERVQS